MFFKNQVAINCIAKKFLLELSSIKDFLILIDFALKDDRNK